MTTKVMVKSLAVNIFLTLIKIISGILCNCKSLVADGIHSLSDFSTDIVAIIGTKIANKKPDESHPFGHGKFEYVTSIFISMFILVLGVIIFKNSFTSKSEITSYIGLIVILFTIFIKLWISRYLINKGKELNSNILVSSGKESSYDVLSSVCAFVFVGLTYFSNYIPFLKYTDMIGGIVISLFIIKAGISIFLQNIKSVLGEAEKDEKILKVIENKVLKNDKVIKLRRMTLLKYGQYYSLTIEIQMDGKLSLNEIYQVEKDLKSSLKEDESIKYVTVNISPID